MNLTGRAWEEVRDQPLDPFVPLLETLRREWREPSGEWARLPGGEDCAAFGLGDTRVVKLVPPGTAVDREIGLLGAVEGRLPVVTPRVWGDGNTRAGRPCS